MTYATPMTDDDDLQAWLDENPAPPAPVYGKLPAWSNVQFNFQRELYREATGQ